MVPLTRSNLLLAMQDDCGDRAAATSTAITTPAAATSGSSASWRSCRRGACCRRSTSGWSATGRGTTAAWNSIREFAGQADGVVIG